MDAKTTAEKKLDTPIIPAIDSPIYTKTPTRNNGIPKTKQIYQLLYPYLTFLSSLSDVIRRTDEKHSLAYYTTV